MMEHLPIYLTSIVIGLIPAFIARGKGRNFWVWWFFGAGVLILALPAALLMKPIARYEPVGRNNQTPEPAPVANTGDRRPCPHCAESIKVEARFCRFCQLEVPPLQQEA